MKSWLPVIGLVLLSFAVNAQRENPEESEYDENYEFPETKSVNINFGVGLGIDYGGIGGKLSFVPTPHVAIFGSIGYNLNGAGYNGGVIFRILPERKVCPYGSFMYGYNAVIIIDGMEEANKTYYGGSISAGIELHRREKPNFWNFGLIVPIRSQEFRDDMDALKRNPNVEITEALPFGITVGYHFSL
jgi:hypothetical protein